MAEQLDAERAFQEFSAMKTEAASKARVGRLLGEEDRSQGRDFTPIGNAWTRQHYGGDFYLPSVPGDRPAISLVFVQSREGNTVTDNPADLGGGNTDLHLIYEGLSRVAADAVMAGAATAKGRVFFSVWHPELVKLRDKLFLPRHPAQIVLSRDGNVDLDNTMLFNVPDVPIFVIAGPECRRRCLAKLEERPWITVIPTDGDDLTPAFQELRKRDIKRISAVGGRATASSLLDAGLVQDVLLTTTSKSTGAADTPFYTGRRTLDFDLIGRKRSVAKGEHAIRVEHFQIPESASARRRAS